MSSLQDKMYNHEVTPPANTWDKIAASLDESEIENEFPTRLYSHEVSPPANTWDKITAALDDSPRISNPFIQYGGSSSGRYMGKN